MLPPDNPIISVKTGRPQNYLEKLCEISEPYLAGENIKVALTGYSEVIERYLNLEEGDTKESWELTKIINGWTQYISSLANLVQDVFLDAETEKLNMQSQKSIEHSDKNVSSGDRYANTQMDVIRSRKRRNALKSLFEALRGEVDFLERAYYHCKATCDWNSKASAAKDG